MADPPDAARSLILFANSRPIGRRADLLADPGSAQRALAKAGLTAPSDPASETPLTPATVRRLIALRTALNEALAGEATAWTALDDAAARLRLRLTFEDGGTALRAQDPDDPVAAVLLCLHEALAGGAWLRIRRCANDVCAVAFYDTTRSRTQRWHSYAMCGNRTNVAAHRARR
jgi:predicted RNA-binding Zn ribbon-like protein